MEHSASGLRIYLMDVILQLVSEKRGCDLADLPTKVADLEFDLRKVEQDFGLPHRLLMAIAEGAYIPAWEIERLIDCLERKLEINPPVAVYSMGVLPSDTRLASITCWLESRLKGSIFDPLGGNETLEELASELELTHYAGDLLTLGRGIMPTNCPTRVINRLHQAATIEMQQTSRPTEETILEQHDWSMILQDLKGKSGLSWAGLAEQLRSMGITVSRSAMKSWCKGTSPRPATAELLLAAWRGELTVSCPEPEQTVLPSLEPVEAEAPTSPITEPDADGEVLPEELLDKAQVRPPVPGIQVSDVDGSAILKQMVPIEELTSSGSVLDRLLGGMLEMMEGLLIKDPALLGNEQALSDQLNQALVACGSEITSLAQAYLYQMVAEALTEHRREREEAPARPIQATSTEKRLNDQQFQL